MPELNSHLNDTDQLAAVVALGDPVRRDLFALVRDSAGGLSRDDCAGALDLPKSTARAHLDRLVESGLLRVEFRKTGVRQGPGSGRPAKLYVAAVDEVGATVPARRYDLAAQLLAAAVQRSIDTGAAVERALADVAYAEGFRLGDAARDIGVVLDAAGYSPTPDGDGGTVMANCPFHRLSIDHTGVVCSLNGSLLAGALAGCGNTGLGVVPDEDISHCCARIVPTL